VEEGIGARQTDARTLTHERLVQSAAFQKNGSAAVVHQLRAARLNST